ncbi:MAG: helix-turn-helix domain-containing protein [Muribaculaceae bacterium]
MKYSSILSIIVFILAISLSAKATESNDDEMRFYAEVQSWSPDTLITRGNKYLWDSQPAKGLICFTTQSLRYSSSMPRDEKLKCADAYVGKWFAYFFWYFDFARALENLSTAQQIMEEIAGNQARIYLNYGCTEQMIGEITADTTMLHKAIDDYTRSFNLSTGDPNHVTTRQMAFSNLITVTHELRLPTSTLDSIINVFKNDPLVKKSPTYNVDLLYQSAYHNIDQGNYSQSIEDFTQMQEAAHRSFSLIRYELIAILGRAEAHWLHADDPGAALPDLNLALDLSDSLGMRDTRLEILRKFTDVYDAMGDERQSMQFHNHYVLLKDSLLNYQQGARISDINARTAILGMEKAAGELQTTNRIQRTVLSISIAAAVILLIFIILLYIKHRRLQQANRALYDKAVQDNKEPDNQDNTDKPDDPDAIAQFLNIRHTIENCDEVFSCDFNVARLAEIMKMQPAQISKVINSVSGDNFSTLINHIRIKHACHLITDHDATANLTLEAIAEMVGFKSRTSFIQAFKKYTGLTPSEFKRIHKSQTYR